MGQHTWFYKDKDLYLEMKSIYAELEDKFKVRSLADEQRMRDRAWDIYQENAADEHDAFRTEKRDADGHYIEEEIMSKDECEKWLIENSDTISFIDRERLNGFWEQHPNGCIDFG